VKVGYRSAVALCCAIGLLGATPAAVAAEDPAATDNEASSPLTTLPGTPVAPEEPASAADQDKPATGQSQQGDDKEADNTDQPESEHSPAEAENHRGNKVDSGSGINEAQARKAAELAVNKARIKLEKARATYRLDQLAAKKVHERSERLAKSAATSRRDMGNIARAAYTSGGDDLNLLATLLAAESPQEVFSGAGTAAAVAGYKHEEWLRALQAQERAEDLAAEADDILDRSRRRLERAKADVDAAIELAESVDLEIAPTKKVPPVDLETKSDWVFPTGKGKISSQAGMRLHPILRYVRCHAGADITAPSGTPIFAVDDGIVLQAGSNGGYGNYTLIAHGKGLSSAYAHQQVLLVKAGDRVRRGQLIGEVGSTGLSTGAHLHFEAKYHGKAYDPRGWLEDAPELRVPAC
jgi:murein DD-endopeptidase MepM/ murein hydrolase activator NlpD